PRCRPSPHGGSPDARTSRKRHREFVAWSQVATFASRSSCYVGIPMSEFTYGCFGSQINCADAGDVPAPVEGDAVPENLTLQSIEFGGVWFRLLRPVVSKVGMFAEWPLILTDLHTREGVIGRSSLEPYLKNAARYVTPALLDLAQAQQDKPLAPLE